MINPPLDEGLERSEPEPESTRQSGMDDPAVEGLLAGFIGAFRGGVPVRVVAIKRHGEPDDSAESLERRRQALIDEEERLGMQ